jgi:hypothetical protein
LRFLCFVYFCVLWLYFKCVEILQNCPSVKMVQVPVWKIVQNSFTCIIIYFLHKNIVYGIQYVMSRKKSDLSMLLFLIWVPELMHWGTSEPQITQYCTFLYAWKNFGHIMLYPLVSVRLSTLQNRVRGPTVSRTKENSRVHSISTE